MENEKERGVEEEQDKGKKKKEARLPPCTTAPSAEHARANLENEPCDDFREGE